MDYRKKDKPKKNAEVTKTGGNEEVETLGGAGDGAATMRDPAVVAQSVEKDKEGETMQCAQCGKFVAPSTMKSHLSTHKLHRCKDCGQAFDNKYRLSLHRDTHLKLHMKCPKEGCKKTFSSRVALKSHIQLVHAGIHTCDLCGKSFSQKYDMLHHRRGVHEGIKVVCSLCGKEFVRNSDKNRHERDVHGLYTRQKGVPASSSVV